MNVFLILETDYLVIKLFRPPKNNIFVVKQDRSFSVAVKIIK